MTEKDKAEIIAEHSLPRMKTTKSPHAIPMPAAMYGATREIAQKQVLEYGGRELVRDLIPHHIHEDRPVTSVPVNRKSWLSRAFNAIKRMLGLAK